MGHEGIERSQIILSSACNSKRARLRLVDKALRLGARQNIACNTRGSLPFHGYARHGASAYEASVLVSKGFDPLARDAEGRCFAHHAFMSHNLAMARWVVAACPESWSAQDALGLTPMNLCCLHNWRGSEKDENAFKSWAWNALPDDCREPFAGTAWLGLLISHKKQRFREPRQDAAWLSGQDIAIDDPGPVLAELELLAQSDPDVAEAFSPGIMRSIALGEARHIAQALALPLAHHDARRATRSL